MQRLGASFGTALLAIIVQRRLDVAAMADAAAGPGHNTGAFTGAFMWTVVFALVALVPAAHAAPECVGDGKVISPMMPLRLSRCCAKETMSTPRQWGFGA